MTTREHVDADEARMERYVKAINSAVRVGTQATILIAHRVMAVANTEQPQAINVVFDGPPGPVCGRFVEVELDDGRSINAGEWTQRPDGMWALRITELPVTS